MLVVVLAVLLITAAGFLIVVGPLARGVMVPQIEWPIGNPWFWSPGRYGINAGVLFLVITTPYRWRPSRSPALRE